MMAGTRYLRWAALVLALPTAASAQLLPQVPQLPQLPGRVGEAVLSSVGCYQLEGPGITLFEAIDGDYFTILGLPLLPLLAELRRQGRLLA